MFLYAYHTSIKSEVHMTLHLEAMTNSCLSFMLPCDLILSPSNVKLHVPWTSTWVLQFKTFCRVLFQS